MDTNPYRAPNAVSSKAESRVVDRDQCPACLVRVGVWNVINVVRQYRCPNCAVRLTVQLSKANRIFLLLISLLIGIPAIVLALYADNTNFWLSAAYTPCATLFLIVYGTFYFRWRHGFLECRDDEKRKILDN